MSQKTCPLCQNQIDAGEAVCPLCGEKQTCDAPTPQIPWNMIGGAAMVLAALVIGGSGWASVGRAKCNVEKAQLPTEEPTDAIMTTEEARRETSRLRRILWEKVGDQWDQGGQFGIRDARLKPNGVLELHGALKDNNAARQAATNASALMVSALQGKGRVRGVVIKASNGNRLVYRSWYDPVWNKGK